MTIFQAIALAIVQGLTEFLPVSSSGHLILAQQVFKLSEPPIFFDVLLHFGTLGSIFVFFWKDIWELIVRWRKNLNTWLFLVLGSIPAALLGFFLNSKIKAAFNSLFFVAAAWTVFGTLLILASKIKSKKKEMEWGDALFVGTAQALALLPGISRSGSTISAGLARKLPRESVFRFSFLLAIPAILGATILELKNISISEINFFRDGLAVAVAGIVGYFSLVVLRKVLKSEIFFYFGYYCLALGLIILLSLSFL